VLHPPSRLALARFEGAPAHPRLLADAARWAALRAQIRDHAPSARLFAWLRAEGEAVLALPPVDLAHRPGENQLKPIRECERRFLTLAVLWRLTDEAPWLAGARAVLADLARLELRREHYLDDATVCLVLALGLDWLHEALTPEERSACSAKLHHEILEPALRDAKRMRFLWCGFNWNQICNSCLAIGALALAGRDPALAHHVVNRALALVPVAAEAYAPDGLYAEGPHYWGYGTLYHVMQIEALRSAFGEAGGLDTLPGFRESGIVLDHLTGPTGDWFNYFDNWLARKPTATAFWMAREARRPDLTAAEFARLATGVARRDEKVLRELHLALLWLDPAPAPAPAAPSADAAAPLCWRGDGHQPVAVLRSARGEPTATWLALKGGHAEYSHGHMDAGSFVLEAGGVRWALDPEMEDYLVARRRTGLSHAEFFDYAQDSARWRHFRLGAEGHNLLRFDDAAPLVSGHVPLGPLRSDASGHAVLADLAPLYPGKVRAATREATLRPDGSVRLGDRWQAAARPVVAVWQWLTAARATYVPEGLRLEQNGRALLLRFEAGGTTPIIACQDVATLLREPYDAPLPGLTRLVVRVPTAAGATGRLTVTATPLPA
jgi:hypothetical protein